MTSLFKKHPVAVILSVLFHVVLISFFVVQFDFFDQPVESKPIVNTVKATVVDESKVRAEADKLKKLEQQKKLKEKRRLEKIKADRLKEEKKLIDLKNKQKQQEKKIKDQKVAEAARLAKLKKKAAEVKRKKLADAKKRALEKEKQEQADRLSAMLEAANNEEKERLAQKAIASFTDIIRQKIERNWIQPAGNIAGLSCNVRVKLIPGGEVISAQTIKSSNNALFDRSVEIATLKASPLPIPNDPAMFNQFRNLEFIFRARE